MSVNWKQVIKQTSAKHGSIPAFARAINEKPQTIQNLYKRITKEPKYELGEKIIAAHKALTHSATMDEDYEQLLHAATNVTQGSIDSNLLELGRVVSDQNIARQLRIAQGELTS